jgi:hypothetical protein
MIHGDADLRRDHKKNRTHIERKSGGYDAR